VAVAGMMKFGGSYFLAYAVYIAISRMMLSLVMFTYARRVDLNFVWTLYANQILNAGVKVYMQWRLAKQKWANRGNQKTGFAGGGALAIFREAMAAYLTAVSFAFVFLSVLIYTKIISIPSFSFVAAMLFR
ncbi:MAG: transcriptional regulator, partial [Hyphomicrobium sp.]